MKRLYWMNLVLWCVWAIVWYPIIIFGSGFRAYLYFALVPPAFACALSICIAWMAKRSRSTPSN